jgi:hypothetical protein
MSVLRGLEGTAAQQPHLWRTLFFVVRSKSKNWSPNITYKKQRSLLKKLLTTDYNRNDNSLPKAIRSSTVV